MAAVADRTGDIVICGGGIIGCSVAYYLALRGVRSVVLEREIIACAASGKAGGFLARTWCDGDARGPLARASFDLHMQLAEDPAFSACGYRRVSTLEVAFNSDKNATKLSQQRKEKLVPSWLADEYITECSELGKPDNTAQVHPKFLTEAFMSEATRLANSELRKATVSGLKVVENRVTAVKLEDGSTIGASQVILTLGPWMKQAWEWAEMSGKLRRNPIQSQRAHSIVMRPREGDVTTHCLFTNVRVENASTNPEIYPRPDGTVYACGASDNEPLPVDPALVVPKDASIEALKSTCSVLSTSLATAELVAKQACYLPVTSGGLPVIGAVPNVKGLYMAGGHSCWGVLLAPATGKMMAELMLDGRTSLVPDVKPFSPK